MKKTRAPIPKWHTVYDDSDLPAQCTVDEASNYLRVSRYLICRMLDNGEIKGKKFGREWRIPKSELTGKGEESECNI